MIPHVVHFNPLKINGLGFRESEYSFWLLLQPDNTRKHTSYV